MKFNFNKLAVFWQKIPKRTKAIFFLLLTFSLILCTVNWFLTTSKINDKNNLISQFDADWQKYQPEGVETPFFNLKPNTQSDFGILPKETFILTTATAVDSKFISQNIVSNVDYELKQLSGTSYEIKVKRILNTDEVVSFSFPVKEGEIDNDKYTRDYNWAFQVQPKFGITSVLPGDQKTSVPLKSGIEIVFNQDGYRDPTKYISITPNINWRSERHGSTFSIVPLEPLLPKTVYTVTLKKGLDLESRSDPLTKDFSFSFQTEKEAMDKSRLYLSLSKNLIQTSSKEVAGVSVYVSNKSDDVTVKTKIFKFANSSEFIQSRKKLDEAANYWYRFYNDELPVETKNLSKISEADLKLGRQNEVDILKLPEALPAGYYLIQFWYNDSKDFEQLWLQSTDISAYTSVGRRQSLVWANEVISGLPINGASVSIENSSIIAYTSADGVSVFNTPKSFFDKSTHYVKVSTADSELVLPVKSLKRELSAEDISPDDYWSYIYHERFLYKPGDTLYFWGILKDRNSGQIPSSAEIVLTDGYEYYDSYEKQKPPLASVKINPNNDGSFIGSLSLAEIPSGYHQVAINVNGKNINYSGFSITDYEKPELKIEVSSNKKAIFTDEKVEFTAKVSFFDGTPAKNIPLDIYLEYSGEPIQVKTDRNGIVKYTYSPTYKSDSSNYPGYPRYESITIKSSLVSNDNMTGYGSVLVFGEKLTLNSSSKQDGKQAIVSAQVNRIILNNLNQNISSITKGDLVANQEVNLIITKNWWEKIENGTYYDFIEKVTQKSYRYVTHEEKMTDTALKTNGEGQISHQFEMEENKSYKVTLSLKDKDGHPVTASQYFYYYKGNQSTSDDQYSSPKLILDQKENKFSLGDQVDLSIQHQRKDYPDNPENRFLYILSQNGRQDFFVQDSPKFRFEFNSKYIPNVSASAIIFTGQYYQITTPSYNNDEYYYWGNDDDTYFNSLFLRFDSDDNKLNMTIFPDKDKYGPGDKAIVKVIVKKGDQSLSGVRVNLVLVDQAMEAIGGVIKPTILSSLYSSISNQIYYNYYSHKPISYQPPQAEKGGGGGDNREIFKDTPFFSESKTDDNGEVVFEIQLPDNITTWLIYSQALTADLLAGQAESSLVSTKDFFVTGNYPLEYLTGDTAYVSGNGFGAGVEANQNISYQVKVFEGDREISNLTGQGKSSSDTQFKLPKVAAGDYKVWVKGTLGNLVDGLTQPFRVVDSRVRVKANQRIELAKGESINQIDLPGIDEKLPVKLVISDIGYGKYFHQLNNFCYTYSNRIEKYVAKEKANKIIKERFGTDHCPVADKELITYQNNDGGLSQVVWGGSVLETTVWSIFVDPEPFDKQQLISYFENELKSTNITTTKKIYALWGLSLLDIPKLNELNNLANRAKSFNDQVIIGLALASQGDVENSRRIYDEIIANYAWVNKPYMRIQAHQDSYINDTSMVLLLGSLLQSDLDQGFYLYLDHFSGQTEGILLDLSRIAYLDSEMSNLPQEDSQVRLTSPGFNQTIDLSKGRSKIITLPGKNLKTTKVEVNYGKAEINSFYNLSSESFSQIKSDDRLSISRQYTPVDSDNESIYPGTLVGIQINYDLNDLAPESCYTITDYLPSGLTFISDPGMFGLTQNDWVRETSKNVVQYTFCNSNWWRCSDDKVVNYYARATAVGTYMAEPAVFQSNLDLSIIQATKENTLKIDGAN